MDNCPGAMSSKVSFQPWMPTGPVFQGHGANHGVHGNWSILHPWFEVFLEFLLSTTYFNKEASKSTHTDHIFPTIFLSPHHKDHSSNVAVGYSQRLKVWNKLQHFIGLVLRKFLDSGILSFESKLKWTWIFFSFLYVYLWASSLVSLLCEVT